MHQRKRRRRTERLCDKYEKNRNLVKNELFNETNSVSSDDAFAPLHSIPGIFNEETLLNDFYLLQKCFPNYSRAIGALLQPHISSITLSENNTTLIGDIKNDEKDIISEYNEWLNIERIVRQTCPSMLTFFSSIVKIKMPVASCSLKPTVFNSDKKIFFDFLGNSRLIQIKAHKIVERVTASATSSDGILAIGLSNGKILIYDMILNPSCNLVQLSTNTFNSSMRLKRNVLYFHQHCVNKILQTKDVHFFLSCDSSGTVVFWNALKGTAIFNFYIRLTSCIDMALCQLSFAKDYSMGPLFLTANDDGGARLFCAMQSHYLRLFPHDFPVKKVASYDQFCASIATTERVVRLWNLLSGELLRSMKKLDSECMYLSFFDETRLCAISELGTIYIFNVLLAEIIYEKKLAASNSPSTRTTKRENLVVDCCVNFVSKLGAGTLVCGITFSNTSKKIFLIQFDLTDNLQKIKFEHTTDFKSILQASGFKDLKERKTVLENSVLLTVVRTNDRTSLIFVY